MKPSAPKWSVAGSQLFVKIFQPSEENQDAACWLVVTAIRTRITSTSRPEASARIWKPRSPSGRRTESGLADPAGLAGSAFTAVLTISNRSDLRGRADLAQLRCGRLVDVGRKRRVVQRGKQLLAVSDQVADVRLEHRRGVRARLGLEDEVPRLVGDGVRPGPRRPQAAERHVGLERGVLAGGGRRGRRRRDEAAGLVLDRGVGQAGGLGVGEVHVPDGPGGRLDDLCHPAVAVAGLGRLGPVDVELVPSDHALPADMTRKLEKFAVVPDESERTASLIGWLGRLVPELIAVIAGSFQVVILPSKMSAMTVGSSFRSLTPDRLYESVIGPITTGK